MTTRNDKVFKVVEKRFDKAFEKAGSKKYTEIFAKSLEEDVRKRVRLGYGVTDNYQPRQKLKDISTKTIETRKALKRKGRLHPLTRPSKSNLTRTGQLLDSLVGIGRQNQFIIEVLDFRNDGVTNTKIVEEQEKQGRPFLFITDKEQKRLNNLVKRTTLKILRKEF